MEDEDVWLPVTATQRQTYSRCSDSLKVQLCNMFLSMNMLNKLLRDAHKQQPAVQRAEELRGKHEKHFFNLTRTKNLHQSVHSLSLETGCMFHLLLHHRSSSQLNKKLNKTTEACWENMGKYLDLINLWSLKKMFPFSAAMSWRQQIKVIKLVFYILIKLQLFIYFS